MNEIECDPEAQPNGEAYKKCIAWHQVAGCNYACMEMCSGKQRMACQKTQASDRLKGKNEAVRVDS